MKMLILEYFLSAGIIATVFCQSGLSAKEITEKENKMIILDFYNEIFANKNISGAADKYISQERYTEHNPHQLDEIDGFKTTLTKLVAASKNQVMDIKRCDASGDRVWVHGKTSWVGQDVAFVDIFKMENRKIIEHWDVIQPLPSSSLNSHPMF